MSPTKLFTLLVAIGGGLCIGSTGCAAIAADGLDSAAASSARAIGGIRTACASSRLLGGPSSLDAAELRRSRRACAGAVTAACYQGLGERATGQALTDCIADGVERCEAEAREACSASLALASGPLEASDWRGAASGR